MKNTIRLVYIAPLNKKCPCQTKTRAEKAMKKTVIASLTILHLYEPLSTDGSAIYGEAAEVQTGGQTTRYAYVQRIGL